MPTVPEIRVRDVNAQPIREERRWILYWMIAFRRTRSNFALQRAAEWARKLSRPLVVFEALRAGYPWANDRLHRFVLDGMHDNGAALETSPVLYYPWVEPKHGDGRGLLQALAQDACVVVTDDFPAFFLPRMVEAAGRKLEVRLEAVDGNGLLPLRATNRVFSTAASFRTWLSKNLAEHLSAGPVRDPLRGLPEAPALPAAVRKQWPRASSKLLSGDPAALATLAIDHGVPPADMRGGSDAAQRRLRHFVRDLLPRYAEDRDRPELDGTSRLSPYLHFGHLGSHEVLEAIARAETGGRTLTLKTKAGRRDLFGLSENAEAFLDEVVTWRELGFNFASKRSDATGVDTLPAWARQTLQKHRRDPRPKLQSREALEGAATPDPFFNAAMWQLRSEGWFHNVARMIWGKKLLEYSESPEGALETMAALMNRYSLDGRGPNSISGFHWVLGRYDRPWGPERPIFGTVRFMTSDTPEKLRRYRAYIERWAPASDR